MRRRQVRQIRHAFPGQRPLIPVCGGRRLQRQPVPGNREITLLIGPGECRAERAECLVRHDAAGFVHRERSPVPVVRAHRGERVLRRRGLAAVKRRLFQPREVDAHVAGRVVHDVPETAAAMPAFGPARNGLALRIAGFLADQFPDSGESAVRGTNRRGTGAGPSRSCARSSGVAASALMAPMPIKSAKTKARIRSPSARRGHRLERHDVDPLDRVLPRQHTLDLHFVSRI